MSLVDDESEGIQFDSKPQDTVQQTQKGKKEVVISFYRISGKYFFIHTKERGGKMGVNLSPSYFVIYLFLPRPKLSPRFSHFLSYSPRLHTRS